MADDTERWLDDEGKEESGPVFDGYDIVEEAASDGAPEVDVPAGYALEWFPKQMQFWEAVTSGLYNVLAYGGAIRGGKAIDLTTPIPTPDGWTTMGELR